MPRDAMHKRGPCRRAVSVCLSFRPSVTFVYPVEINKHIFIFSPPGSHAILVSTHQTLWQYSDEYMAIGWTTAVVRSTIDGRLCSSV